VAHLNLNGGTSRVGSSGYFMAAGLLVMVIALAVGVPGHGAAFVLVMCVGWGLIAYGLLSWVLRLVRE
jgi:hypothetical protein